jgi:putative acetyltransferase
MDRILLVRRERAGDVEVAREVQWQAFSPELGDDPPVEVVLLDALRASDAWIPELSLVAVLDGEVVGHVVTTRGHVDGRPALGLGPIGVEPAHQGGGIGSALVHASAAAAEAMGEPLVALLGSTEYYGRFGFVPAHEVGVEAPDPAWGDHFQVRTLASYSNDLRGSFEYAAPFSSV